MLLKRGAEAELRRIEWHGRKAVEKVRHAKAYRQAALDDGLRRQRIRMEARLMHEVRLLGLSVPLLYDVDLAAHRLVMEFVDGPTVKELLQKGAEDPIAIARSIGRLVGTLHANGLVHGDLTTSNMIWRDGRIYLIDLSMGEKSGALESQGVDLRLLEEAWTSAHYDVPEAFEALLEAYRATYPKAEGALTKLREIEERGRYT